MLDSGWVNKCSTLTAEEIARIVESSSIVRRRCQRTTEERRRLFGNVSL